MQELIAGIRSRHPVTLLLLAVNVIVFVVLEFMGNTENTLFMLEHGAACTPFILEGKEYYRLFTSMFLHFGIEHLFGNMLGLFFLGDMLEGMLGKVRFLLLYLTGGVIGNVVSMLMETETEMLVVSAGASGAVFAIIGALAFAAVANRGQIKGYSGRGLIVMAVFSVIEGVTASGVDGWAHIGGFLTGTFLALLFIRRLQEQPK